MLLTASQLKLFYSEMEIFADVSVEVGEHARIGLVGPNGSGKTSLLRVLTGSLEPDGGYVSTGPGLRIAYVSQMPEHDAPGTLRDEVQSAFQKLFDLEDELAASALEIQQREGAGRRRA
ncbi:MAG: ATP-binding cassette domain-containing protein, partial [Dehalococcoidia bacterium]|nr:ATP-binding cassette domain-containing protein [Dehalococcoidia bacterium]